MTEFRSPTPIAQQAYAAAVAAHEARFTTPAHTDWDRAWIRTEQARLIEQWSRPIPSPAYVEEQQARAERANPGGLIAR